MSRHLCANVYLRDETLGPMVLRVASFFPLHRIFRACFKHAFLKRYEKFCTFLRNEICSNNLTGLGLKKGLERLAAVREKFLAIAKRFATFQAQCLNVHGEIYNDILDGSYDCVDPIVVNAFFPIWMRPGGVRLWWRALYGCDDLDNAYLMRTPGRFSRRLRAWAKAKGVPLVDCPPGQRKHEIAEQYLSSQSASR